jgi:RNA polymerase primary sigma factor
MATNLKPSRKRNIRRGAPPIVKPRRMRPRSVDGGRASGTESATPVAANDAKAVKRKKDDPGNFLATYFREMAALEVLKPEEEFVAARDIEALELLVWERALTYPPLCEHLLATIEPQLESPLTELRGLRRASAEMRRSATKANETKLHRQARKVAVKLREVDNDRVLSEMVLAELDRIARGLVTRSGGKRLRVSPTSGAFRTYYRRVRQSSRGAAEARNSFVRANLRLVVSIARRFNHGRMALADLIQEGNLGLMKAVERYDYRRGFRFSTYASWWIRHAISRALADKGREVRLPVHMIDAYHRISKATRELTAKLGRQPTVEEIGKAANLAAGKIEKMRTYLVDQSFSLDKPVNDEDGRNLLEYLQDPNAEENSPVENLASEAVTEEMRRVLSDLKPIEADILRKRFGLDDDQELTLKEIGQEYNLSRERIRQLQEQALWKMRRALARKDLI